ncbi:WG repeat-containing protein [Flavobacterium alkalisoli]|uniref:WG repeat-containing protein n=1 Tax=Flavobacterium alkalisoli TaxID=2602769 RepID=A0A5B9FWP0_9FLAO|nr:WG repeat-containing protein [Flavobacterium alkalisoli]QEE51480.1 WG repeat-containing protein [Flavobacterium alkalisoli]
MRNIFITTLVILSSAVGAQEKSNNKPENWIKVEKDGFTGYIDEFGQEIVPAIYDDITDFGIYCPDTAVVEKDGFIGLISLIDGNQVCKPQYESMNTSDKNPNGWIMVEKDGFYGFIDCNGQEVVKPIYSNIEIATENGTEQ